jgi:hypothetical protein
MFGAIKNLNARVQAIDQARILTDILDTDSLKAQMIDLNRTQLYEEGVQADGTPTGEYAPVTINYYKPLAAAEGRDGRTEHITLKDTGAMYESMKVESLPEGFKITAEDPNDLQVREPKMLGLTKESIAEIIPEVKQRFLDNVKEKLFA